MFEWRALAVSPVEKDDHTSNEPCKSKFVSSTHFIVSDCPHYSNDSVCWSGDSSSSHLLWNRFNKWGIHLNDEKIVCKVILWKTKGCLSAYTHLGASSNLICLRSFFCSFKSYIVNRKKIWNRLENEELSENRVYRPARGPPKLNSTILNNKSLWRAKI